MRKWGRRVSLFLVVATAILVGPLYLAMFSHARSDSEAGVMMYGINALILTIPTLPAILLASSCWAIGLIRELKANTVISRWESSALFATIIVAGVAILLHWEIYASLIRSFHA